MADDIGRVEPAAEPGFEQHDIGRRAREGEKRGGGRDLEKRDRFAAIGALALVEHREQRVLVDQFAGEPDALVKAHEVRRDIDVHPI